jgi:hypothetical protein
MSLGQQQAWALSNAAARGCTCCASRAEQIVASHSSMRQNGAAPSQTCPRRLWQAVSSWLGLRPCRLGLCPRGLGCALSDLGCALVARAAPLLGCILADLGGLCPCGLGCNLAVWGCALVAWAVPLQTRASCALVACAAPSQFGAVPSWLGLRQSQGRMLQCAGQWQQ